MGRWYKIPKDSPTGKRLQAISDRIDVFQEAWMKFKEKYGIKSCTYYSEHLCDVLAMDFDHEPDAAVWHQLKRGDLKDLYKPISGTDAYKDWQKLRKLRVERIELDHAMGDPTNFPDVGIHWANICLYQRRENPVKLVRDFPSLKEKITMYRIGR